MEIFGPGNLASTNFKKATVIYLKQLAFSGRKGMLVRESLVISVVRIGPRTLSAQHFLFEFFWPESLCQNLKSDGLDLLSGKLRKPVTNIADYYFSNFFVVRGSFSFVTGWHKWQSPMRMQQLRVSREMHLKIEIIFDKYENFEFIVDFFCRCKSTFWPRIVQFWIFRVRTGIPGLRIQPELTKIRSVEPWIRINRYKSAQQWNRLQ